VTAPLRASALALAAALAACGNNNATQPGLLLAEPGAVAAFRGFTSKDPAHVQPYIAVANAASNDLTIIDARNDTGVPAPVQLRTLVFPVPGRPTLLASAELGDDPPAPADPLPDLLVAVSAGGSELQVIETWDPAGGISTTVNLGGDILALVAVPSTGRTARIAAALSGNRIAVAEFARASSLDPNAIVPNAIVPTAKAESADLGFQPVALAAMTGQETRIWAARPDLNGVAEITIPGFAVRVLDAPAPTRLVAAAELAAERPNAPNGAADPSLWVTTTPLRRVYAVLDESGCGDATQPPCGLVALDADGTGLAPDFVNPANPRAPIPIPGRALALAASGPPADRPPSTVPLDLNPLFMRIVPGTGLNHTTGVAGVASSDGSLYFVDLGRFEIPSNTAITPTATKVSVDPSVVVSVSPGTAGFTPTARWTATFQGGLPGLASLRVDPITGTRLAFQVPIAGGFTEVVRIAEVGIGAGDLLVVSDPEALGSCAPSFEATVVTTVAPNVVAFPGGALDVVAAAPQWDTCLPALAGKTRVRATVRGGGWILVRGTAPSAILVDRPHLGDPENVVTGARIGYVSDRTPSDPDTTPGDPFDPALVFRLDPVVAATAVPRGAAVVVDTNEGRAYFRVGGGVDPRAVVPFDRSRHVDGGSIRFFVPYGSNSVLDASPSVGGGGPVTLR
jgi:hypothetical protein